MTPGDPQRRAAKGVEWICLRECLRFARRHRRYFVIFLILYWHSLWHWKSARAARYGYAFLQLYDDIMDGDRAPDFADSPDAVAARTIAQWQSGIFLADTPLSRLAAALHAALRALPLLPNDDPHADVLALLHAMRRDAQRVATRALLTQADLTSHLRATFHHSLNLLLIASRLRTRAAQVPDLVAALAWCSVIRDWREDLDKGLINVPAEIAQPLREAGIAITAAHPDIARWLDSERTIAHNHLRASEATLKALSTTDPRAARLLGTFQRSIARYAEGKGPPH